VAAASFAGAVALAASQFLPLFHTRIAASRLPIDSVTVGSAHGYALLPIAALVALLAYGVWSVASRPALLAIAALGVASIVISLARDLSLAQRSGLRLHGGHYVLAANSPASGLYLETAAATLLIVVAVSALVLLGPAPRRRRPAVPQVAERFRG
jgi:hypothetical protein